MATGSQRSGGSGSPAAHLQGGFLEQHSLAFQLAPASIVPAEDNTLLGVTTAALFTKPTFFRVTFNTTLRSYLIDRSISFLGYAQATQQSQLLGYCFLGKDNACKIFVTSIPLSSAF